MEILLEWCCSHDFDIANICAEWIVLQRTAEPHCAICMGDHGPSANFAFISRDFIRLQCEYERAIRAQIVIWARTDFRDDFANLDGTWAFNDVDQIPNDLTTEPARACFRKFMQQTLAYARGRYYARVRNEIGEICFERVKPKSEREWILEDGEIVSLRRAIERVARELITWDDICFTPYLRAIPLMRERTLNLWTGYARAIGHVSRGIDAAPFFDYICDIWCCRNHDLSNYVLNWFADLIQNPANPSKTALLINGSAYCYDIVDFIGAQVIGRRYSVKGSGQPTQPKQWDTKLLVHIRAISHAYVESYMAYLDETANKRKSKAIHYIVTTNSACPFRSNGRRLHCVLNSANLPLDEYVRRTRYLWEFLCDPDAPQAIFEYLANRHIGDYKCHEIPFAQLILRDIAPISSEQAFLCDIARHKIALFDVIGSQFRNVRMFYKDYVRWCGEDQKYRPSTEEYFHACMRGLLNMSTDSGNVSFRSYLFSCEAIMSAFNRNGYN